MKLKEFNVKQYSQTFSVVAINIDDVSLCYPNAESIIQAGEHDFYGDGSLTDQTLTKATPITSAFTGVINATSFSSHTTIPETGDAGMSPGSSVAFHGPYGCISYKWEIEGFTSLYDQHVVFRFESAGTFIVKLTCISDGGEAAPQYAKIVVGP